MPHIPQHRTLVRPPPVPLPPACVSCTPSLPTAPWPSTSCTSYTASNPPSCTCVLLALRRLLSTSLALRSEAFAARRSATWYIIAIIPLVSWSTVANIEVGELFWWSYDEPRVQSTLRGFSEVYQRLQGSVKPKGSQQVHIVQVSQSLKIYNSSSSNRYICFTKEAPGSLISN